MRKVLMTVGGLMAVVAVAWGVSTTGKPSAQSKSGAAVAYAKADIAGFYIYSFGGKGTKTALVTAGDQANYIIISFQGKYPKDLIADQVILNATAQTTATNSVVSAEVLSVSPSQIVVEVVSRDSTTGYASPIPVFVSVFCGF